MSLRPKVWKSDKEGLFYHDGCFEEGESRDGFTEIASLDDLSWDDACESCGGEFLSGLEPPDDDDDGGDEEPDDQDDVAPEDKP